MNVPPSNSNTSDTVVDVGSPRVLKMSRIITSLTITARKITITSWKVKFVGCITPWRATSIIPADISAPSNTPSEAIINTVLNRATLAPMAEVRKFTASLLTPTNKSNTASVSRNNTTIK